MNISIDKLIEEKTLLQKDFDELNKKIKQVEMDVIQMRANMNAINGAIQQVNKLIGMAGGDTTNPVKKEDDKKV